MLLVYKFSIFFCIATVYQLINIFLIAEKLSKTGNFSLYMLPLLANLA